MSSPVCMAGDRRNGSDRTPKPDVVSISPNIGLRIGTASSVRVSRSTCVRARLMRNSWRSKAPASALSETGTNGPPVAWAAAARQLAEAQAEIGEQPAHAPGLGVVAFLQGIERRHLARFHSVKRFLQARQHAFEARSRRLGRDPGRPRQRA